MNALQALEDGQVEIATGDAEYKTRSLFLAEKTGENGRAKDSLLSTLLAAWFLPLLATQSTTIKPVHAFAVTLLINAHRFILFGTKKEVVTKPSSLLQYIKTY